ncbi:MAG: type II toxin-antitoxin system VapC family toxin [Gemmatimonadetes bacterium]|nr:type II toxin-antitoxin system VapC family toxin [Gemmatimonadota bacterium]
MIVVDASLLVDMLMDEDTGPALQGRLLVPGLTLHTPHLADLEVAHAVRRHALNGSLDDDAGLDVLRDLTLLPLHRYAHDILLGRVWELRGGMSAYDACYVALAEVLDAPLLTRDAALARTRGHDATIEFVTAD